MIRTKSTRTLLGCLALVLALTACGEDAPTTSQEPGDAAGTTPDATAESTPAPDTGATGDPTTEGSAAAGLAVAESPLGGIVVDGEGNTLYLFDNDEGSGESTCEGDCAANWPPFTVEGDVEAGAGLDSALVGTTERSDGTTQVTYNGHPLYYFAADQAPGDANGQAVGDIWWVVGPDGEAIRDAAASSGMGY